MSTTNQYRDYNSFNLAAISTDAGNTDSSAGWIDGIADNSSINTPLNADNLNAMLKMLIYIRNIIGKTGDFSKSIGDENTIPSSSDLAEYNENKNIGKYILSCINKLIGTDSDNLDDNLTLNSLKSAINAAKGEISGVKTNLDNLDYSANYAEDAAADTQKWVQAIKQTDGKIEALLTQPSISDISATGAEIDFDATKEIANLDTLPAVIQKEVNSRLSDKETLNNSISAVNKALASLLQQLGYIYDDEIGVKIQPADLEFNVVNSVIIDTDYLDIRSDNAVITDEDGNYSPIATQKYVQSQIKAIKLPETDLSNYYTKLEVDNKFAALDISNITFDLIDCGNASGWENTFDLIDCGNASGWEN